MEVSHCPVENMDMNLSRKNILVTGGTGFVGSHLVSALVEEGARVVSTYQSLDPRSYFSQQELSKHVAMENVDLVNYEKVMDLVTKFEIEYIFHLGAQALVDVAYHNPRRTYESNIMGTVNLLEAARLYPGVKGIVVASSDKAYGKVGKNKYVESMALQGDHPYEASKSATDLISQSYHKTYNVPVAITRFGNIYGEGDLNLSRIIPGAVHALINKKTLEIRSDGKFVRDYIYVKDVVDGYILLMNNIKKARGEAYNFGSKETLSVLELLEQMKLGLGEEVIYKILNQSKNEIPYQSLSYAKIKKQFGWEPKNSIATTIQTIKTWSESYN